MGALKIRDEKITLVDQVEQKLIDFFKQEGLQAGDPIPNEYSLSENLGVARSVLREALSRFKMTGMIESRTRRGMILAEPSMIKAFKKSFSPILMSEDSLLDLLEFRIVLEMGCAASIFRNITDEDIKNLEEIVKAGEAHGKNQYSPIAEYNFHTTLYAITGNKTIRDFQEIIFPILEFIEEKYQDYFGPMAENICSSGDSTCSHEELVKYLKEGNRDGYEKAIRRHFKLYTDFLTKRKVLKQKSNETDSPSFSNKLAGNNAGIC